MSLRIKRIRHCKALLISLGLIVAKRITVNLEKKKNLHGTEIMFSRYRLAQFQAL